MTRRSARPSGCGNGRSCTADAELEKRASDMSFLAERLEMSLLADRMETIDQDVRREDQQVVVSP